MAFQPINLGTPNNNDGDSLYAGGVKINSNFTDVYENLAGSSSNNLKVNVGTTTPNTSTILSWNSTDQEFQPGVNDNIRNTGVNAENALFITDASGFSGSIDQDLTSVASTLVNRMNGRDMLFLRSYNTTSTASTRGALNINLGNANVTSLSVFTTGAVVRGSQGLEIYRASAPDTATYTPLMTSPSTSTGLAFYQTPTLDLNTVDVAVRTGSDSSNALAHTGFVKINLRNYAVSSTQIISRRGIIASVTTSSTLHGGTLETGLALNIDGIYHPKHIEGLIYNYNTIDNKITLVTGAAAHWSYSTSGVAGIIPTTSIAMVASYNPIIRTFTTGWTPQYNPAGTTNGVIDGSISANTWYYLYYLGCLIYTSSFGTGVGNEFWPGSSNVIVSSNRDIASVDAQLAAAGYGGVWQVVRRLGPVRSNATGTGIVPFNVKRIDHGGFEYYWGLQPNADGDTSYTYTINTASLMKQFASNATFTLADYNSAVLTTIPPIPGITAHITVRHTPAGGANAPLPEIRMYGDSWTVNSSISALFPPFETVRSMTTGLVNVHTVQLPMIPDGCYIPDGVYGGAGLLSVTTSTGLKIRWAMIRPQNEGMKVLLTSTLLQYTVHGFRLAR